MLSSQACLGPGKRSRGGTGPSHPPGPSSQHQPVEGRQPPSALPVGGGVTLWMHLLSAPSLAGAFLAHFLEKVCSAPKGGFFGKQPPE